VHPDTINDAIGLGARALRHFAVHDGERLIGRSSSATYFIYECDPGQRVFSFSFGNLDILNADLLPDRIYYVKVMAVAQAWGPAWSA